MKIYNKVIIDLESGDIVFEDSFEHNERILECKGGGSTSTTTVDYAYNRRLATIAEQQQGMAKEYFDFWKSDYKPYEKAQIRANTELMPGEVALSREQTAFGRQKIGSQRELLPGETALSKKQTALGRQKVASQQYLLPFQTDIAGTYYGKVLEGVNPEEETGRARADVQQAFKLTEGERRREFSRMGVDPSSPAFAAQRAKDMREKAKAMAGAGTKARRYARDTQFARLRGAM